MWEKTVMTEDKIYEITKGEARHSIMPEFVDVAKAQAERTGDIAEKKGIRKAVEWIKEHKEGWYQTPSGELSISSARWTPEEWDKQLKEWDIKE